MDAGDEPDPDTAHDTEGILEEYQSLRQEIVMAQQGRLFILGFASAAIGVILGVLPTQASAGRPEPALTSMVLAGQLVMLAALVLTVQRFQSIIGIAEYMRVFIEPNVSGIKWETRLLRYKRLRPRREFKLGAGRAMAAFYLVMTLSVAGVGIYLARWSWWLAPVIVLAVLDLVPIVNLWRQASFGWRYEWELVRDEERAQAQPPPPAPPRPA